jgi:transcriptional regulator with PAS, ATPase and Fis domain
VKVDVRVISATNRNLAEMIRQGKFREDLFYRLNVVRIAVPPLRDRKEDIPLLVEHFLQKAAAPGEAPRRIEIGALQLLLRYSWPGNVRELENEIRRLAVLSAGSVITQQDIVEQGELFEKITRIDEEESGLTMEEMEKRQIQRALLENKGNRGDAARSLGISRATIFRKMRRFGLTD